jgi:hypothetical protein
MQSIFTDLFTVLERTRKHAAPPRTSTSYAGRRSPQGGGPGLMSDLLPVGRR